MFQKGNKVCVGRKFSPETIEKLRKARLGKKHKPETLEKMKGENHHNWRGDNIQYKQVHIWIREHYEIPERCQECNIIAKLDLANTTGIYSRDINNFQWLCRSCHQKLDFKRGLR